MYIPLDRNEQSAETTSSTIPTISSSTGPSVTSELITTPQENDPAENRWLLPVIIGLSCLAGVILLGVSVVVYRKWKCFGLFGRKVLLAKPIQKLSFLSISSSGSNYSSRAERNKYKKYAVKLNALEETATELSLNSNSGFGNEFRILRQQINDEPTIASLKQHNILKNRFSNILAYDRTRFVLTEEEESLSNGDSSDYINANYVSGFRFQKEFIATQGPLRNTVNDFWRMCWESKCSAVVMLTKCYEKGNEKCYPYWPTERGVMECAGIRISLQKQSAFRIQDGDHLWLVSELTLEKDGDEDDTIRTLLHFVFLSWPDFGVVDPPQVLISFVKEFRKRVPYPADSQAVQPIVIHCSAGVGRSGVFIALDYLIQQLEGKRDEVEKLSPRVSVNVFHVVSRMRKERMAMVQTQQQYILIYRSLVALVNKTLLPEPSAVGMEDIQVEDWGLVSDKADTPSGSK